LISRAREANGEPVGWVSAYDASQREAPRPGEDSICWDSSKNRYVGAVSLGFSPAGARVRRKVTGRTKAGSATSSGSCTRKSTAA
jgi:hypothetical protein